MLKKGDHTKQMVYYQVLCLFRPKNLDVLPCVPSLPQAGIGTYTTPQIATPLMSKMSKVVVYPNAHLELLTDMRLTVQTLDAAVAWNLDAHVMCPSLSSADQDSHHLTCFGVAGYEFLMQNCTYLPSTCSGTVLNFAWPDTTGDRICIFGFSRGAYTARR